MKKFKGFTNQQTHTLLKEMGYTGPAQKDDMDAFLASSPSAASKLGRYADIARQRIEGGPLAPTGFADGSEGAIENEEEDGYKPVSRIKDTDKGRIPEDMEDLPVEGGPAIFQGGDQEGGDQEGGDQEEDQPDDTQDAFQPGPVLKEGTETPEVSEAAKLLDEAQKAYSDAMANLTDAQQALDGATIPADDAPQEEKDAYEALQDALADAEVLVTQTAGDVSTAQRRFDTTDVPSTGEALGKAISTPSAILAQPTVYGLEVRDDQIIDSTTGKVADALTLLVKQAQAADSVENPVFKKSKAYLQGLTPEERNDKYPPFTPKEELYTSVEDGTPEERKAAGTSLSTKILRHVTGLEELTPEDIAKYDVDGDGQLTIDDNTQYMRMAEGLQEPNEAFKDFFLNKYPSKTMPPEELAKARDDYYAAQQTQIEQDAVKATTETFTAVESEEKIKALDKLGEFAEGALSDEAKMEAETMTPTELEQLKGKYADPAKLESYNVVLNEDDIVRINQERKELKVAMIVARLNGDSEGFAALEEAYNRAGDSVRKAYETGTVVGNLEEDEREYPSAAVFADLGGYTKAEAAKVEKETALGDIGDVDPAKFEDETPEIDPEVDYTLPPTQKAEVEKSKVEDAARFPEYASEEEKKSEFVPDVTGEERDVSDDELADINDIINDEEAITISKVVQTLDEDAKAKATSVSFTESLKAKFDKGEVSASSTVAYQMEKLMNQFNDGTPPWAAGALRRANAAMAARGLAGSSMAGAAIIQAAMEAAVPIAQADAATFAAMDMENVRNKQAIALANAAAAQNFKLTELEFEQQKNLQDSMNAANLQLTNQRSSE